MTDAPCRDAPRRIRVRSKGAAEENALRMADAPRRVPTCTMCHAIFLRTPTVRNELKSSVEEVFSKSAPRGLSMSIDRHLPVPAILVRADVGQRKARPTRYGLREHFRSAVGCATLPSAQESIEAGATGRKDGQDVPKLRTRRALPTFCKSHFAAPSPDSSLTFQARIEQTPTFIFSRLARLPCVQNVRFSWFLAGHSLARGADFRKNLSADSQCKVMKQRIKRISFQPRIARIARIFFLRPGGRCCFAKGKNRCSP